ncbi:ATP-binding protein (plasmid) [Halobacterium sp. MBLA0001]|uniref:ATP-binding protein n=1 Tax=Halobacterium TaxID=2239 RepID=UPI003C7305C3
MPTADTTLVTDTEQTIQADASRLRQVVENLIWNAVEYGIADVPMTIGELKDGFYVAAAGPGISEDVGEQVFELEDSTNGEGLGCISSSSSLPLTGGRSP